MNITEYFEAKKKEFIDNKQFKEITFQSTRYIRLTRRESYTTESMILFQKDNIPLETEVKECDSKTFPLNAEIQVIQIACKVIKPRCRKPEYFYMKVLPASTIIPEGYIPVTVEA